MTDKTIMIIGDNTEANMHLRRLHEEGYKKVKIFTRYEQILGHKNDAEVHFVYKHWLNKEFSIIFDYIKNHNISFKRID